mgnify:FL=1|jgi:S-adenosylmethionine hydrolase
MKNTGIFLLVVLVCSLTSGCAHRSQMPIIRAEDGSVAYLMAKVVRISEEYANINTNLSGVELSKYGITDQKTFTVKYGGRTIRAFLGKDYSDVPKGNWVALIEEDGNLQLAISFGHAATDIGCIVGDALYIEPLSSEE